MASTLEILNAANLAFLRRPPAASFLQASPQSIANVTDTAITWPAPGYDNYSGYSAGTPTRYTAQVPGYYQVLGAVSWAVNATGNRLAEIHLNGVAISQGAVPTTSTVNNATAAVGSGLILMNGTTDYVELFGFQNSGGSLNTNVAFTQMTVRWVHD